MTVTEKSVLCAVQIISDHFKKKRRLKNEQNTDGTTDQNRERGN